jgi:NAD(P)-dependent dehydrogenase (short-subunit alcohol dehydrogenase family)
MSAEEKVRLDGRVAVVTGAAQGLGEATAKLMSELGARVVLLDIDGDRCSAVAEAINAAGGEAHSVRTDIADESSVEAAAEFTRSNVGVPEVLVNNAAIVTWSPLEQLELVEWDRVIRINLTGTFLCVQQFGRPMLEQGRGSIVNVASVAASTPESGAGAYSATKAGVEILSRQIAVEWGPRGIRANTVSPGVINGGQAADFVAVPKSLARRKLMIPSGRIAEAEEIAWAIAFLATDASSFVNGQNVEVDGGMMQMMLRVLPHPGIFDEI